MNGDVTSLEGTIFENSVNIVLGSSQSSQPPCHPLGSSTCDAMIHAG
jgi:hypothetical protein